MRRRCNEFPLPHLSVQEQSSGRLPLSALRLLAAFQVLKGLSLTWATWMLLVILKPQCARARTRCGIQAGTHCCMHAHCCSLVCGSLFCGRLVSVVCHTCLASVLALTALVVPSLCASFMRRQSTKFLERVVGWACASRSRG